MCRCVALYGPSGMNFAMTASIELVTTWLSNIGLNPTTVRVAGPRLPKEPGDAAGILGQISKSDLGRIRTIEFYTDGEGVVGRTNQWTAYAALDRGYSRAVLCADVAFCSRDSIQVGVEGLLSVSSFTYGFGYARGYSRGPEFYSVAMGYGMQQVTADEAEEMDAWWNLGAETHCFCTSYLRSVYPRNFLSEAHLSRLIGGISLGDWIRADPSRGILSRLTNAVWQWDVNASDIARVKGCLSQAHLLVRRGDL
jgi:hypothetical protein